MCKNCESVISTRVSSLRIPAVGNNDPLVFRPPILIGLVRRIMEHPGLLTLLILQGVLRVGEKHFATRQKFSNGFVAIMADVRDAMDVIVEFGSVVEGGASSIDVGD